MALQLGLITAVDALSMGQDRTSDAIDVQECRSYCVQAVWSAGSSPVGVFYLQGSVDASTYTDITSSAVSGNSGSILFNVELPAYRYIKTFYDYTSGTGTLTVKVNLKG